MLPRSHHLEVLGHFRVCCCLLMMMMTQCFFCYYYCLCLMRYQPDLLSSFFIICFHFLILPSLVFNSFFCVYLLIRYTFLFTRFFKMQLFPLHSNIIRKRCSFSCLVGICK